MGLFIEVVVVGVATAIIGFIVSTIMMVIFSKEFRPEKYHFWWQVILSYFITGCLIHILCEISGTNKWYCTNGVACKKI